MKLYQKLTSLLNKCRLMLIKYLLNGKTIDLTSDIIKIQSNNFSVDETGRVTATAGEIGGFTTTDSQLSSKLYSSYAYSQTDLDKIRDAIMGTIELTPEEFELYDVDGDGEIKAVDYMMVGNYINTGTSQDNPGEVIWNNSDVFKTFTIKDGTGETIVNLNAFRNYIMTLFSDSINTGRINADNIQFGTVNITPKANTPTSVSVDFYKPFSSEPTVVIAPMSSVPGTTVLGTGVANITETGFDAVVTRTNTTTTVLCWIAVE